MGRGWWGEALLLWPPRIRLCVNTVLNRGLVMRMLDVLRPRLSRNEVLSDQFPSHNIIEYPLKHL